MTRDNLIAMSYAFISYLFREKNVISKVKRIFLFGSVARGDFDEESDIDLFIDVEPKDEAGIKKISNAALGKFYSIEGKKWEYKGITNPLKIKVGEMKRWELKTSVEKEGVVLYSQSAVASPKKYLLFTLDPIQQPKKRVKVTRRLFGRKERHYNDQGIIGKLDGKVISPRVFLLPANGLTKIASILSKETVQFRFEEVWK